MGGGEKREKEREGRGRGRRRAEGKEAEKEEGVCERIKGKAEEVRRYALQF